MLRRPYLTLAAMLLAVVFGAIFSYSCSPGREQITTEQGEVACEAEILTIEGICDPPPPMTPYEEFLRAVWICGATTAAAVDDNTPCREYEP